MAQIKTEIIINSSAENVWNNLLDFENYSGWNAFIKEIQVLDEPLKVGSRLKANLDGFKIKPKVREYQVNRELRWLGRLYLPRLFDGEHIFKIEKLTESQVRFIQEENFRGILVWLVLKLLGKKTKNSFMNMNQSLKELVESKN